jgi:hypothetical protein
MSCELLKRISGAKDSKLVDQSQKNRIKHPRKNCKLFETMILTTANVGIANCNL